MPGPPEAQGEPTLFPVPLSPPIVGGLKGAVTATSGPPTGPLGMSGEKPAWPPGLTGDVPSLAPAARPASPLPDSPGSVGPRTPGEASGR